MKILFIATGFAPSSFSENIVNSKLVLAFLTHGWEVDVISKRDEGAAYSRGWDDEWNALRPITHEIPEQLSGRLARFLDIAKQSLFFGYPIEGVRWARRAYEKSLALHQKNRYDIVMSRSPSDISHIVAERFSRTTGTPWIANWNDPASGTWPEPYTENLGALWKKIHESYTGRMIAGATVITFPSFELRDHFAGFFPSLTAKQSAIIPHIGMLPANLQPKESGGTFRICHSGNLSTERNPSSFLKALAKFIRTRPNVAIQADFMGYSTDFLTSVIKKYRLDRWVKYIGAYPYVKSLARMATYDLLLLIEADVRPCIFLPSKFADYALTGVPILAISPRGSCVTKLIERFGGGRAVDCNAEDEVLGELDSLYTLWQTGRLRYEFDNQRLHAYFSSQRIVSMYRTLFSYLKQ